MQIPRRLSWQTVALSVFNSAPVEHSAKEDPSLKVKNDHTFVIATSYLTIWPRISTPRLHQPEEQPLVNLYKQCNYVEWNFSVLWFLEGYWTPYAEICARNKLIGNLQESFQKSKFVLFAPLKSPWIIYSVSPQYLWFKLQGIPAASRPKK